MIHHPHPHTFLLTIMACRLHSLKYQPSEPCLFISRTSTTHDSLHSLINSDGTTSSSEDEYFDRAHHPIIHNPPYLEEITTINMIIIIITTTITPTVLNNQRMILMTMTSPMDVTIE